MTPGNRWRETLPEYRLSDGLSQHLIHGYALRDYIGSGSFGTVYRAEQPGLGRDVAIKILRPEYANHPDFIRRFEAEAQLVARLEHPHIVPLYDFWREPSGTYLVMRYVSGGNLGQALARGPWSLDRSARLLDRVGAALAVAHRHGVVHRDVKPANILLDEDGNAYLADFGIAKNLGAPFAAKPAPAGDERGTPEYLAPEQLCEEPVTLQSDLYSLGVVLYEMLAGAHPFADLPAGERLRRQLQERLPPLHTRRADVPEALDRVIQRATAKQPTARYPDALSLVADIQEVLSPTAAAAGPQLSDPSATPETYLSGTSDRATLRYAAAQVLENPYKGLRAFQEADEASFFGRTALIQRLLTRLADDATPVRFLAVVGPSGSGKSSVVRAGLIPALRRGALPHSDRWFVADMLPGAHPLEELEAALLRVAVNPPPSLLEQLATDERGLLRAIKRVLPTDEQTELVLLIDQFEEIFTLVADEATRMHFLNSLLVAVTAPRSRLRLIVTLRADFYDRPLLYPGFSELVREYTEVVTPLTQTELQQAITGPAARAGVTLEPALVAAILRDVAAQPGTLPLLQYALTEPFEWRQGHLLTLDAYQSTGGVPGALARRADDIYNGLDGADHEAARQLFLRLVMVDEGSEDTRRRVPQAELEHLSTPETRLSGDEHPETTPEFGGIPAVIDAYARYRLLTFDRDPVTRAPTVEVAHEALIRTWDRLRGWLDESRADLRVQRRLAAAAAEWASGDRDPSFLATGARLAQFEGLADETDLALSTGEQAYLAASSAERDRQVREERARQATLAANLRRSEALRLAAEATVLLQAGGKAELIALLSIRSMTTAYTPQGDAALAGAVTMDYPVRIFDCHGGVTSVAFSPDGQSLLIAAGSTAQLWDLRTGTLLRTFAGHTDIICQVRFSPDGRSLLTSSNDATVRLWDVQTGQELRIFAGHTAAILPAVFSPDGSHVLSGSDDTTARLWDVETGRELHRFTGHTAPVVGVAYTPDGRHVATSSFDATARLWDVATGAEVLRLIGHTAVVQCIAYAPDGSSVVTGSYDKTARLWDVRTGDELRQFIGHGEYLKYVAFSPDGRTVLTGSDDGTARLWDVQTGVERHRFVGHTSFVFGVAFSPDGAFIATGSGDGTARLWSAQPHIQYPQFAGHRDGVTSVALSLDGKFVLTGGYDKTARLSDARTGAVLRTFVGHSDMVRRVVFSPDGRHVLTASNDKTARLWDVETEATIHVFAGHRAALNSVAFSSDGKIVVTASYDKTARLWDAQTGVVLQNYTGHTEQIFDVAFSPDGRRVVTGSVDGTTRLWDTETATLLHVFPTGAASVACTVDGLVVLTGDWGGNLRLWDLHSGTELRCFTGHTASIWQIVCSPDGRYVLTASGDQTARLWDATTGAELRRFAGHSGTVYSVALSPDGRQVLTGSSDGTARLWDVDYHETMRYLCGRLLRDFDEHEREQYGIPDDAPTCPDCPAA